MGLWVSGLAWQGAHWNLDAWPVSLSPGAWIITGGSHTGVMKQVGEAVRDFSLSSSCKEGEVITIGIATWGTIHNREGLTHRAVSSHSRVNLGRRRKAGGGEEECVPACVLGRGGHGEQGCWIEPGYLTTKPELLALNLCGQRPPAWSSTEQ